MKLDYDIIIIGDSIAGYEAALYAAQLHAKVALVKSQPTYQLNYVYPLRELSRISHQYLEMMGLGICADQPSSTQVLKQLQQPERCLISSYQRAIFYAQGMESQFNLINSLDNLATQGVDIIIGRGEFVNSRKPSFRVQGRTLRGSRYLLACGSVTKVPDIENLATTGYVTLTNIWHYLVSTNLPKHWVIIGGLPQSIEIAQTLAHLGCHIDLVLNHPTVLSHLEPEIVELLIAQLEAEGVSIFREQPVTQTTKIKGQKWVQLKDQAIETDEILIANHQQPKIENLNLASPRIKSSSDRLITNDKLQTTNPNIYACGDIIGGYDMENIAKYEAKIAVKNALFFPRHRVNYSAIPWIISTQPIVARVGITELQAKKTYNKNRVLVFKNYFKTTTAGQIKNETTGICKLIVLENGKILGCSIFGQEAEEIINLIGLAIAQNLKIDNLENLAVVYPSCSEILTQTAREWSTKKLHKNHLLQEFLQSFLHFRREWKF